MNKRGKFYIAQIEEEKKEERKSPKFVSPYGGTSAKDNDIYPYVQYGNNGKQYNGLNGNNELNAIYTGQQEEKKEQDKYSPDRIPSYYRKEGNLGINRNNLADLRGDKLSNEEILERNRRQYGNIYQNTILEEERQKELRRQETFNTNNVSPSNPTYIQDPLNAYNNPKYDFDNKQPDYSFDSTVEDKTNNYSSNSNNVDYSSNYQNNTVEVQYNEPIQEEQVNRNVDFFRIEDNKVNSNNILTMSCK